MDKQIPVVSLQQTVVGTRLVQAGGPANQEVRPRDARDRPVESERSLVCRGPAAKVLVARELASEAHSVAPSEPAHRVANLIDVAGIAKNIVTAQAEVPGGADIRQLRDHHARIVGAEIGKLGASKRRSGRIVALHSDAELV